MNIKKYQLVLLLVLALVFGFFAGWFNKSNLKNPKPLDIHEVRATGYKYISPLLRIDIPQVESDQKTAALKSKIEQYISESISQKQASVVSVYFRDPGLSRWFSINSEEKYTPASAMKIVTLMAYLKKAEDNTDLLKEKIKFSKPSNATGYNFSLKKTLKQDKLTLWINCFLT